MPFCVIVDLDRLLRELRWQLEFFPLDDFELVLRDTRNDRKHRLRKIQLSEEEFEERLELTMPQDDTEEGRSTSPRSVNGLFRTSGSSSSDAAGTHSRFYEFRDDFADFENFEHFTLSAVSPSQNRTLFWECVPGDRRLTDFENRELIIFELGRFSHHQLIRRVHALLGDNQTARKEEQRRLWQTERCWVDSAWLCPKGDWHLLALQLGTCVSRPASTLVLPSDVAQHLTYRVTVKGCDSNMVLALPEDSYALNTSHNWPQDGMLACRLTDDSERGWSVRANPSTVTMLKFLVQRQALQKEVHSKCVAFRVELVARDGTVMGETHIAARALLTDDMRLHERALTRGHTWAPILRQGEVLGTLYTEFVMLRPWQHPQNALSCSFRRYHCPRKVGFDIGHRGVGRSFRVPSTQRAATLKENTLASYAAAYDAGAELVELDVVLTKDRVPIIFHDFLLHVIADKRRQRPASARSAPPSLDVGLHKLTLAQLEDALTLSMHWLENHNEAVLDVENNYGRFVLELTTLKDVLLHAPKGLGLNVEIKYPILKKQEHLGFLPEFEINSYVDTVLDTVFSFAGNRRIIFSCFHPEVCVALKYKQTRYPVMFLSEAGQSQFHDSRANTLEAGAAFAWAENMQGVVANAARILDENNEVNNAELVRYFRQTLGHVLWTWGDVNSDASNCDRQREMGVNGIIADNIADVVSRVKHLDRFPVNVLHEGAHVV